MSDTAQTIGRFKQPNEHVDFITHGFLSIFAFGHHKRAGMHVSGRRFSLIMH